MAYSFTAASSQYLSTASAPLTAIPATLAAWCKPSGLSATSALVYVGLASGYARVAIQFAATSGDATATQALTSAATNATATLASAMSDGVFNNECGVFSSNASRAAIVNGNKGTNTTSLTGTNSAYTALEIGSRVAGGRGLYMNGALCEVAVWSVALTDDEVASLGKGFKPTRIRPQSLVFYAPLIRDLQDTRGGLTITNNNSATVADHPRVY